jgi:hypothetical protein
MDGEVAVEDAIVITRIRGANNPLLRQLFFMATIGLGAGIAFALHASVPVFAGVFLAALGLTYLGLRDRKKRTTVRASREGIRIGEERIARAEMPAFHRLADPTRLVIPRGMRVYEITLLDQTADAITRALEMDSEHTAASVPIGAFPLARAMLPLVLVSCLGAMALRFMRAGVSEPVFWAVLATLMLPMALIVIPGRARIGGDGVLFRWLFVSRFVRARDIDAVVVGAKPPSVELKLKNGSSFKIPMGRGMSAKALADPLEALKTAQHEDRENASVEEVLLAERTGSVAEWITRLRGLANDAGFRALAISPQRLWEVLENRDARPEARIAAVVALAPTLDDAGRARVRVVAETVATPHVRVALETATQQDADSAELERLLKLVE